MSTRAVIIQRGAPGKHGESGTLGRYIVVAEDGNPGGVGATLLAHYGGKRDVDLLMCGGHLRTLGKYASAEFLPKEELGHVSTGGYWGGGTAVKLYGNERVNNVRGDVGADYAYVHDGAEWYVYRPGDESGIALTLAIKQEQADFEAWRAKWLAEREARLHNEPTA